MAKKVLTPEEVQAKLEKKAAKRKLFFGTFTKALAFFLAIALAYSLAIIAFTPATVATTNAPAQQGGTAGGSDEGDNVDFGGSTGTTDSTGSTGSTGSTDSTGGTQASTVSKADAVKAVNEATKKAATASYTWARKCWYTDPVDVGSATSLLNGIIQGVDENASLDSVVGGFLDITGTENDPPKTADVVGGKAAEGMKEKFVLKAMELTEGDVKQYQVDGNKYMFQLNACTNPQKDGSNALHHATNDFITFEEVNTSIAEALGEGIVTVTDKSQIKYSSIVIVATIENGSLTNLELSYALSVNPLDLSVKITSVKGTGAGKMSATYSNFKY